ncbi:MAG: pyruvate carboxylase subunit B [Chitinivibrionales bacterium]|nr:pyruvate carboxylase subunit B [Chitinivibrionales bacterium]MBD3394129.1 pyruvate carboxylase subunit B [Chitinivibrionales bacterium]
MAHKSKKEKAEEALHRGPLRITDTTLRDAHQSLWATRMRTDDILRIVDVIDAVGYYSLECWGGATFDVCLRFLRENPWERLRLIKSKAKNTPLQMLLRGQNIVGYRNYADDVVDRFVALACENGIDIFRIFDALNDTRNLEAAIKAVKKYGGHAQGTLSYTLSPVHTIDKYVQYAKEQAELGIDSLCIKDMAGILSPIGAERLVKALVEQVRIPVQLHCHATSGMATATYVDGVRAGAGAIDCAISPMAGSSAQPPVETLAHIFSETNYAPKLDMDALQKVARYFNELAPKRRLKSAPTSPIDPGILVHQIPGGMISNFRSQLAQQHALDRLPEVLDEVSRVRKDLGYPPLVTPTSQIVGTQAVMNILSGERYKIVPQEVQNYVRGLYGRSPVPIDSKMIKKILGKEKPITHRPADTIEPMLRTATEGIEGELIEQEEDILSYCILPEPALEYFKWRRLPPEERPEIPADAEIRKMREESAGDKAASARVQAAPGTPELLSRHDFEGLNGLLEKAKGLKLNELSIRKGAFNLSLRASGVSVDAGEGISEEEPRPAAETKPETPARPGPEAYSHTIDAPLVGTFYASPGQGKPAFAKVGDKVKAGDTVCIVEAMKLFNEIKAPEAARIVAFLVESGGGVQKGQPLVAYEPA